jgi:hypothetical protein
MNCSTRTTLSEPGMQPLPPLLAHVWAALLARREGAKWGDKILGVLCGPASDEDLFLDPRCATLWRSFDHMAAGNPELYVAREMARWHRGTELVVPGSGSVGDMIRRLHVGDTRPVARNARRWVQSARTVERGRISQLLVASRSAWRHSRPGPGCPPRWTGLWHDLANPDEGAVLAAWREDSQPRQWAEQTA